MNPIHLSDDAIIEALRAESTQMDAPEHVIQRAFTLWKPKTAPAQQSLLSKIMAVLKFDSSAVSPMALGVRSIGSPTRQMLFSAEGRDIDLRIAPRAKGASRQWDITGQVLGPDDNGSVSLRGTNREWSANLNDLSEFHIEDIPEGEYQLMVLLNGSVIVLPEIKIPAH
jgi:hypothetical protein